MLLLLRLVGRRSNPAACYAGVGSGVKFAGVVFDLNYESAMVVGLSDQAAKFGKLLDGQSSYVVRQRIESALDENPILD